MKEKYYKNGSLLEAKLGHGPSLVWRSLWSALGLIRAGVKWRVGDGRTIKIWKDSWLPIPISFSTQAGDQNLEENDKVQKLLMLDSNGWNEELVKACFNDEEAQAICSILLSRRVMEDRG